MGCVKPEGNKTNPNALQRQNMHGDQDGTKIKKVLKEMQNPEYAETRQTTQFAEWLIGQFTLVKGREGNANMDGDIYPNGYELYNPRNATIKINLWKTKTEMTLFSTQKARRP